MGTGRVPVKRVHLNAPFACWDGAYFDIQFDNGYRRVKTVQYVKPDFRRLFSDGLATVKYEIGFSIDRHGAKSINVKNFREFIKSLLGCQVELPVYKKTSVRTNLLSAGKYLAEQYRRATVANKYLGDNQTPVFYGSPCIYIERSSEESLDFFEKAIDLGYLEGVRVQFFPIEIAGRVIPMYDSHVLVSGFETRQIARELRIAILNLNAFRGSLLCVLKNISNDRILPTRESPGARNLNRFLMKSFGHYLRIDKRSKVLASSVNYEGTALAFEDIIKGGAREKLRENLRDIIDVRGNYFKEIVRHLEKQDTFSKLNDLENTTINLDMSEQNNTNINNSNNSGVINTGENSGNMQVVHNEISIFNNMDYDKLAEELKILRQALKDRSEGSIGQDVAISNVAQAEQAAMEKDPSKVIQFLKAAGKWALDAAKDLGVDVTAKLIEHSLGLN